MMVVHIITRKPIIVTFSNAMKMKRTNFENQGRTYNAPATTVSLLRKYDKEDNKELFGVVMTLGLETGDIIQVEQSFFKVNKTVYNGNVRECLAAVEGFTEEEAKNICLDSWCKENLIGLIVKPLTKENAPNVALIINFDNIQWGTKKFNYHTEELIDDVKVCSFGQGANSAILFEEEFHFWGVASLKGDTKTNDYVKETEWLGNVFQKQGRIMDIDTLWAGYPFKFNGVEGLKKVELGALILVFSEEFEEAKKKSKVEADKTIEGFATWMVNGKKI